ncbi:MAG: glycosyltransferase family 4 protein [Lachnospiraceae bacterium]|nr:glycosyltransferase family 4 protein [Lachnospiraceae bacterium]
MDEKKKIVLVGPVYPYKGGISHYTGMLYRALAKKHDVTMVSYKMQYPKFLFKKEQRDYSNDSFKVEDTNYWLNTANPFNIIATALKIRALKPDMVVIQWWHPYFAPCYMILTWLLKGIKVAYVCHNVFPHERFPMDKLLTRLTLKSGDHYTVQSALDARDLLSIKPDAKFCQTQLPTFNAFKFKDMSKEEAREILQIPADQKVLLFFGFVREYKGLKYLIQAMPGIKKKLGNVKLLVVGDFGDDKDQYMELIEKCGVGDVVETVGGYIPDREVEKYFAASDLVVLPYISATQSAVVQIAYGFTKPVIVTDVGGLPEVVNDGETGYVVKSESAAELAKATVKFFDEEKAEEFAVHIKEEEYKFSWDRIVEVMEGFLQS